MKKLELIKRNILGIGTAAVFALSGMPVLSLAADTEEELSEEAEAKEEEAKEDETSAGEAASDDKKDAEESSDEEASEELSSEDEASGEDAGSEDAVEEDGNKAVADGEAETASGANAAYTGIEIDGDFSDWKAVPKSEASGSIQLAAVVQDGDYVYIYLRDGGNCCAAWSGPNSNGKFAFMSDLGYTTLFQLNNNPASISGVDGASCAYKFTWGDPYGEWEIAVPVSHLPVNHGSYDFGFYLETKDEDKCLEFIGGISDERFLEEQERDESFGSFDGIVYDGLYGDWRNFPHTLIQYATAGTSDRVVDGEAALYVDGSTLYGHCVTTMAVQVEQGGNDVLEGVVLRINESDDWNSRFEFRFATVDEAGNIDWHPQLENLPLGSYEYIITDVAGWGNAKTLDELKEQGVGKDGYYGRTTVTVGATSTECEWWLDLPLLAERLGVDESDIKVIEVKYEQIGDRWVKTAGASSGAVAGIAMGVALASAAVLRRKKNGE